MSSLIDGKQIAQEVIGGLKQKEGPWREKIFAAFLVGDDKESESFLRQKKKIAEAIGIEFRLYRFPADIAGDTLRKEIGRTIRGSRFGGGIVQLPLPKKFNEQKILNAIPKEKDVDCLSERALGGFYTGRWIVGPPSVMALERILSIAQVEIRDMNVAVIGRGRLIGKPIITWLLDKVRDIHVLFLDEEGDIQRLREADMVITGVGKPHLIKGEHVKEGAVLIDYGYYYEEGRLYGDIDHASCAEKALVVTPTPGGTGPIVVAELFYNFYLLNKGA